MTTELLPGLEADDSGELEACAEIEVPGSVYVEVWLDESAVPGRVCGEVVLLVFVELLRGVPGSDIPELLSVVVPSAEPGSVAAAVSLGNNNADAEASNADADAEATALTLSGRTLNAFDTPMNEVFWGSSARLLSPSSHAIWCIPASGIPTSTSLAVGVQIISKSTVN
jgi:hypothetical protein